MAGRLIGDVFVSVFPLTQGFGTLADAQIRRDLARLHPQVRVGADTRTATASIEALRARMAALATHLSKLRVTADTKAAEAKIAALQARLAAVIRDSAKMKIGADTTGLVRAEARVLSLEAALEKLGEANTASQSGFVRTIGSLATWRGAVGQLNRSYTLFGSNLKGLVPHIIGTVGLFHLAVDTTAELIAVLAPAAIAFAAFGVAGADSADDIVKRMKNVNLVMDATGQAVPPLTNDFRELSDAVQPQVYQLFGDALLIMGNRTGQFSRVAKETGTVVDRLAARFTYAVTQGGGLDLFMREAVQDASQLGTLVGNLGGVLGNLFRAMPGYASILLDLAVNFSSLLETVTRIAEPVIKLGLAFHGAVIWIGLFAALGNKLITVTLLGVMRASFAAAGGLASMGAAGAFAASGLRATGVAAAGLSALPWGWILTAAGALIVLGLALSRAKDSTQQFNASMQDLVANAPVARLIATIGLAQAATAARVAVNTQRLSRASDTYHAALARGVPLVNLHTGAMSREVSALGDAAKQSAEVTAAQQHLHDQYALVSGRVAALSKQYGGNTRALGLLNEAGITSSQLLDKNNAHWAQARIQVAATAEAYKAMGTQAGTLGNDLDVLGRTVTDQYQATQKLNTGWDTFIKDVTGSQGSFDTFDQGLQALADTSSKYTITLGKLHAKGVNAKAAVDDLSAAGVNLNQAFSAQVGNANALIDSWRTAGITGQQFSGGVKAAIIPLVRYAKGSQEATAQLVALAEEAGYQGPVSLKALTGWLGKTQGATKTLKDVTNQATIQTSLLTGAMQAQGSFIAGELLGDINNAILKYNGVAKAAAAYGKAVAESGKGSDTAKQALTKAVDAIVRSEQAMGDNTRQMAAVVSKAFGISVPAAMKLVQAALSGTVRDVNTARGRFELFAIHSLGLTADKAGKLWAALKRQNLDTLAGKADTTRAKFDALASKGLGITREQADKLWVHLRQQYLDTLGTKAGTSKDKFIKLAMDGLGLTKGKAQELWGMLHKQQIDTTAGKAAAAKTAFIKLAVDGIGLTKTKAQDLWDTLHRQQLTDAATKAGETKTKFEKLATQLGVTKGYADRLWDSLHKVAAGSPYAAWVNVTAQGHGGMSYTEKIANSISSSGNFALGVSKAAGGLIDMGTGPTADDVPAMLSKGELVVPADMVAAGAADNLRGRLPGFPKLPGMARGGIAGMVPWVQGKETSFVRSAETDFLNKEWAHLKQAVHQDVVGSSAIFGRAYRGGGGVARWAPLILRVLRMLGQSPGNLGAVEHRMNQESGGNAFAINLWDSNARNPLIGPSKGLMQVVWPTFKAYAGPFFGRGILDPLANIYAGLNYALHAYRGRSLSSVMMQPGGYARGGLVRAMADGGMIPGMATGGAVAALRSKLAWEQQHERAKYFGLEHAFAIGPAKYRTATVRSELATLASRQAAEQRAYSALAGAGLTTTHLHHLGATARAEMRTAADQALSKLPGGHPGFAADLRKYLGQISSTASGTVPAPATSPAPAPGSVTLPGGTWQARTVSALRARLAWQQQHEQAKYFGLMHAFATGPARYRTATVRSELATLAAKQEAEKKAYSALRGAGLTTTHLHHLGAVARSEFRTAADQALNRLPGGHPGFAADLRKYLGEISVTTSGRVPAGSTKGTSPATSRFSGVSAGKTAREGAMYLNAWRHRHGGGFGAAWGPVSVNEQIARMVAAWHRARTLAGARGLTAAQHKHWAALAALDKRKLDVLTWERGIEQKWRGQLQGSDAQLQSWISAASGHPGLATQVTAWKAQLARHKETIRRISTMLGWSAAHLREFPMQPKITHTYGGDVGDRIAEILSAASAPFTGTLGARAGGLVMDRGGWLRPGWNPPMINNTGRPERVGGGGDCTVILEIRGGDSEFERFMASFLRRFVKIRGGGNAQAAFGSRLPVKERQLHVRILRRRRRAEPDAELAGRHRDQPEERQVHQPAHGQPGHYRGERGDRRYLRPGGHHVGSSGRRVGHRIAGDHQRARLHHDHPLGDLGPGFRRELL